MEDDATSPEVAVRRAKAGGMASLSIWSGSAGADDRWTGSHALDRVVAGPERAFLQAVDGEVTVRRMKRINNFDYPGALDAVREMLAGSWTHPS